MDQYSVSEIHVNLMAFRISYIICVWTDVLSMLACLPARAFGATLRFVICGRHKSPQILAPNFFFTSLCDGISHLSTERQRKQHKIKHSPSIMLALQVFYFHALNFRSALREMPTTKNGAKMHHAFEHLGYAEFT